MLPVYYSRENCEGWWPWKRTSQTPPITGPPTAALISITKFCWGHTLPELLTGLSRVGLRRQARFLETRDSSGGWLCLKGSLIPWRNILRLYNSLEHVHPILLLSLFPLWSDSHCILMIFPAHRLLPHFFPHPGISPGTSLTCLIHFDICFLKDPG